MRVFSYILLNSIILCLLVACACGFLFELKSEVTSLRTQVRVRELTLFELKKRLTKLQTELDVFKEMHISVDFVDRSNYYQVVAVTDYYKGETNED